jgi:hypothetical protein
MASTVPGRIFVDKRPAQRPDPFAFQAGGGFGKWPPAPLLPENGDLNLIATNPHFGIAHLIPGKRET